MNNQLQQTLVEYLESLHHLGERDVELPADVIDALRKVRPPAPHAAASAPAAALKPDNRTLPRTTSAPPPSSPTADPPRFDGDKSEALRALAEELAGDTLLRAMFSGAKQPVFGTGDPGARLMFIGEAPGRDEDEAGEPFVGRAGQLLDKMIVAMGLTREAVYIANIVKYRPDLPPGARGNRKPTADEMAASLPYIQRQVRIICPEVIVTLGATALEGLFALPTAPVTRMRGQWKEYEGIPVMPTFHPSYLLHKESNPDKGKDERRKVWEDLQLVMARLGLLK